MAIEAGRWIQASAIVTPHGVTWPANPADRASVATDLYSGSAGVVLFFVELHRADRQGSTHENEIHVGESPDEREQDAKPDAEGGAQPRVAKVLAPRM